MIPLPEFAPRPGELVEFTVPDELRAAAAHAPEHPAPPSIVQENHVLRQIDNTKAGRPQSPWLGIAFELPGRLDTTAMAAALEKWVLRHRTLLTWFSPVEEAPAADGQELFPNSGSDQAAVPAPSDPGRGWETAPPEPRIRLQRHEVPAETLSVVPRTFGELDGEAINAHMTEAFREQTSPLSWPPFTAGAVVREETSSVYFAVDHSHTDGFSMILVFAELRALYQAEIDGTEAELPEVGSYVDACTVDRERAAQQTLESPGVKSWIDFFLSGPLPSFPLELGVPAGESRPSLAIELDLLTGDEADAFSKACKAQGASFSAGLLTALALAGAELAGRTEHRAFTVVHTRDESRWQFSQGWYINLVPMAFGITDEDGAPAAFGELLRRAGEAYGLAKELAPVSPMTVAELTGFSLQSSASTVLPMMSYIDLRHAPGSREWEAHECNALVGPGPSSEVPVWINRLWERMYLKTRYPDTPEARLNVPMYFHKLRDILQSIARTGEYTLPAGALETAADRPAPQSAPQPAPQSAAGV